MRQFKTLHKVLIPNVIEYIREYIQKHQNIEIMIGCDSQCFRNRTTVYGVVVVLYTPGKGGHVICTSETTPIEKNRPVRLLTEVWKGIEVAEFLRENGLPKVKFIDIDLNPDPKYGSNSVLRQAIGLVEGMGYKARCKHGSPNTSSTANHLVRI